ncbi:hypothetical protein ACIOD2_47125 [Amycolatopsis sp. NPDC088138]|uniref:hypothetical protein n=1 Tax=Amycolatopsis sp. NPDC088138 TaxID=3363938 RepID=UPI00382E1A01
MNKASRPRWQPPPIRSAAPSASPRSSPSPTQASATGGFLAFLLKRQPKASQDATTSRENTDEIGVAADCRPDHLDSGEGESSVSSTTGELVRKYFEVWNHFDDDQRGTMINTILTEDVMFTDVVPADDNVAGSEWTTRRRQS